jgi:hypothetical protein
LPGEENCCLKQENSFVQKKLLVFKRKLLSETRKFFWVEGRESGLAPNPTRPVKKVQAKKIFP